MTKTEQETLESLILYSLLKSGEYFTKYGGLINEKDFVTGGMNPRMFKLITEARKFNVGTDTINQEMIKKASYKSDGNTFYIYCMMLLEKPRPLSSQEDFEKLKSASKSEGIIKLSQLMLKKIGTGIAVNEVMQYCETEILKIRDGEKSRDTKVYTTDEGVDIAQAEIESWVNDTTVGSGIPEIDQYLFLNRLPWGYSVIGGRSSAGKTTLLCSLLKHTAKNGIPCIFFSYEMSVRQLMMKMAMSDKIMRNEPFNMENFKKKDFRNRLNASMDNLRKLPLYIKDSDNNIYRTVETARQYSVDYGVKMVGLDYIQMGDTDDTKMGDADRVSAVSKCLKALSLADSSKNYSPLKVVALSQYTESAAPAGVDPMTIKPTNYMLRWSRQIWHDADLILHLYQAIRQNNIAGTRRIIVYCGKQREYIAEWEVEIEFLLNQQEFSSERRRQLEKIVKQQAVNESTSERAIFF